MSQSDGLINLVHIHTIDIFLSIDRYIYRSFPYTHTHIIPTTLSVARSAADAAVRRSRSSSQLSSTQGVGGACASR